jgi:hypothetical protein
MKNELETLTFDLIDNKTSLAPAQLDIIELGCHLIRCGNSCCSHGVLREKYVKLSAW